MQVSSTSSSSTYTNAAYSSSGVSGMISGMDTESLVKEMLSGIQTKIDKQNQQKQQLEWKQDMYRDVITKINSFQSKYLDLTSANSLRTVGFFNQMTTNSSSSAVKIISASSGTSQDMSVQVAQLATAAKLQSGKISSGSIEMADSSSIQSSYDDYFNNPTQLFTVTAGDKSVSVNLWDSENLAADGTLDIDKAITNINQQLKDSDINVSLSQTDGKLTLESTAHDGKDAVEFSISGSTNALDTLGLTAKKVGDSDTYKFTSQTAADATKLTKGTPETASISVTLDGVTKYVTINGADGADKALESFKEQVSKAFGSSITIDSDSGQITAKTGQTLSIGGNSSALGITSGACTRITTSTKLSDLIDDETLSFSVNGKDIEVTSDMTVSDLISKVNSSGCGAKMAYNSLNDTFSLLADETGEGFNATVSGNVADKLFSGATFTEGKNAIINIDGTTVERTSNNFSVNGVTMQAKAVTGNYVVNSDGSIEENADGTFKTADGSTDTAANITAERDTESIKETIKGFVEDYNKLIKDLNALTHASKTYTKYDPLTDDQKKDMKDTEITKWEEKAHEGLLSNDNDINSFLQSMRTALYSKSSSGFSLSQFGINSSSDWKEYGKLEIDDDTLDAALKDDADNLISTFTNVASTLNTACKTTANTSSASPGALVSIAGVEGKVSENNNTIKSRLDNIADKLTKLQDVYDMRKTRYWKQFSSMETSLSNMSSTSNYLTQMLGG